MKSRIAAFTVLLGTIFGGSVATCRAQSSNAVDARITGIACPAELGKSGSTSIARLQAPGDVGRGLSAGNRVRCTGPGTLEILVPQGTKKITSSEGWFNIEAIPAEPPFPEIAQNLLNFGIPGATRGMAASSHILWPSEYSVVIPEDFVIRWTPMPEKVTLSITTETKDTTLWGPKQVDGKAGLLKSDQVSSILAAYKAKSDASALLLIFSPANGTDWEEAHFSVLKGRTEQVLNSQLDFWKKKTTGLALLQGLGYSFLRYKLFAEAADEYDLALKSAPGSLYLLEQAIQANRFAGRTDRVKALQAHLASPN